MLEKKPCHSPSSRWTSDETSPPQMFFFWTQMTLVLVGKGPWFRGLTFKNRGHLGSSYIYIYIWSKLLKNHHIPDEIQKSWYALWWRRRATRSQFWNLVLVWKLLRCWCITILIDFYILVLPSCMSFLKRRPCGTAKLGWPLFPPKLWKSSPDPGSSPSRKERNLV